MCKRSLTAHAGWIGLVVLLLAGPATAGDRERKVPYPEKPAFNEADANEYGQQIAEYADRYRSGWIDTVWLGSMILSDAGGDSVERTVSWFVLEEEGGNKSLVRFLSPAELKGVAALIHEHLDESDDQWLYLPADRKVRRIAGANQTASFQGSEFTYEDLKGGLQPGKYEWRFLSGEELEKEAGVVPCFKVEARPTYEGSGYSRLVVWFNRENWRTEQIVFYDKANQRLKTLTYEDWQHVHDRFWRARYLDMQNEQTGKRTELRLKRLFVDLSRYTSKRTGKKRDNLTEEDFTTRALKGK